MISCPGYFTPSEALRGDPRRSDRAQAVPGGRRATPALLKAQLAVLPKDIPVLIVGGIKPDNMQPWLDAGAAGFGLGGGLYKAGQSAAETLDKGARLCRGS